MITVIMNTLTYCKYSVLTCLCYCSPQEIQIRIFLLQDGILEVVGVSRLSLLSLGLQPTFHVSSELEDQQLLQAFTKKLR